MKIRTKIFISISAIILLMISIVLLVTVNNSQKRHLDHEVEQKLREINNIEFMFEEIDESDGVSISKEELDKLIFELNNSNQKLEVVDFDSVESELVNRNTYLLYKESNKYFFEAYVNINNKILLKYVSDMTELVTFWKNDRNMILVSLLGLSLVLVLLSLIISKLITKDLDKLTKYTIEISKGHFDQEIDLSESNELYGLSNALKEMSIELENIILNLNEEIIKNKALHSMISHEFKTPLTSIIGYSELLLSQKFENELMEMGLEHIYFEGSRLSRIIHQLKDISKSRELFKSFSVLSIINRSREVSENAVDKINFEFRISGEDFDIYGNPDLMESVFVNLFDNAIQANDGGEMSIIEVNLEDMNIMISNHGDCIDSDYLSNLHKPFKSSNDGMGLGLYIVKSILEIHDADIKIISKENYTEVLLKFTNLLQNNE